MAEMLATTGSFEIREWIAEFTLRAEEEREALKQAESPVQGPRTFGGGR